MQKVKIEALGEPKTIQGAKGPFQVFGIKVNGNWVNGYYNKTTQAWKVGDEVEITITEKEKDGKVYKNFTLPKELDVATERVAKLEGRVTKLELSEERRYNELYAKIKSDLMVEFTGRFQTDADFKKYEAPHPIFKETSNPLDGIAPDDEIPF